MIMQRVHAADVTREDIRWLAVGCLQSGWDKSATPVRFVEKALHGDVMLYRLIDNRCRGIVVLSVDTDRGWLWIEMMGGTGLMRLQEEFRGLLRAMAADLGLKHIAGFVSRKALARWYDEHTKGKPVAMLYLEEIEDGRRQTSYHHNKQHNQQDPVQAG